MSDGSAAKIRSAGISALLQIIRTARSAAHIPAENVKNLRSAHRTFACLARTQQCLSASVDTGRIMHTRIGMREKKNTRLSARAPRYSKHSSVRHRVTHIHTPHTAHARAQNMWRTDTHTHINPTTPRCWQRTVDKQKPRSEHTTRRLRIRSHARTSPTDTSQAHFCHSHTHTRTHAHTTLRTHTHATNGAAAQ